MELDFELKVKKTGVFKLDSREPVKVELGHGYRSIKAVYGCGPERCGHNSPFEILIKRLSKGEYKGVFEIHVVECGGCLGSDGCEPREICQDIYEANEENILVKGDKTLLRTSEVCLPMEGLTKVELG